MFCRGGNISKHERERLDETVKKGAKLLVLVVRALKKFILGGSDIILQLS